MQMTASYLLVRARVRAARGISKAPGTRTTSISFLRAPERNSPSQALCSRRSVIKALKRETTIAKRLPEASRLPSSAGMEGSGGDSILSFLPMINFPLRLGAQDDKGVLKIPELIFL